MCSEPQVADLAQVAEEPGLKGACGFSESPKSFQRIGPRASSQQVSLGLEWLGLVGQFVLRPPSSRFLGVHVPSLILLEDPLDSPIVDYGNTW